MLRIAIMSQQEAEAYSKLSHKEKAIMISIVSTYAEYPVASREDNGIGEVLALRFNDVESTNEKYGGIKPGQGKMIADFVKRHEKENIDLLIIHCFCGVSRSAGVALAICEYLGMETEQIRHSARYNPNMLCYNIVKASFAQEDSIG